MVYVVLDDLSTFSGVDGAVVAVLTEAGGDEVDAVSDFKAVELDDKEHVTTFVTINDLLDCWNTAHEADL
jgi:hypothetical protein